MKTVVACVLLLFVSVRLFAQNTADSNFVTVITAANWMPDGKSLLLNVVKYDKTRKVAPVFRGFNFTLDGKKLAPLGFDGGADSKLMLYD